MGEGALYYLTVLRLKLQKLAKTSVKRKCIHTDADTDTKTHTHRDTHNDIKLDIKM